MTPITSKLCRQTFSRRIQPRNCAFTLIELLVVLFIFLLLTSVALPTVKKLLVDQKTSKAARSVANFITAARSRAISESRHIGIRLERAEVSKSVNYGTSVVSQIWELKGTPVYSGESAGSHVRISAGTGGLANLVFKVKDNQLIDLFDTTNAPIRTGNLIELPGGNRYELTFTGRRSPPIGGATEDVVDATINLNAPVVVTNGTTVTTFPVATNPSIPREVSYRIYRSPVKSSASSLVLPKGVVIDLNYSGSSRNKSQFAPKSIPALPAADANRSIDIIFGPDGRIESVARDNKGVLSDPDGIIFLCLGSTDGIRPDNLFSNEKGAVANLLNLKSLWIAINPNTGRVTTAPNATVSDFTDIEEAIEQARYLALLSDTMDTEP